MTPEERWAPFREQLLTAVPQVAAMLEAELARWIAVEAPEAALPTFVGPWPPSGYWFFLCSEVLDEDHIPRYTWPGFWPAFLGFLEVAAEACERLREIAEATELGSTQEERAEELMGFVESTVLCDLTHDREGFLKLLPMIGPRCQRIARSEIQYHHGGSRSWGPDDLDWSSAGQDFVRSHVHPADLLPLEDSG